MPFDIPDDPIIRWMERTGYPPWMQESPGRCRWDDDFDDWEEDSDGDVFYGNQTSGF